MPSQFFKFQDKKRKRDEINWTDVGTGIAIVGLAGVAGYGLYSTQNKIGAGVDATGKAIQGALDTGGQYIQYSANTLGQALDSYNDAGGAVQIGADKITNVVDSMTGFTPAGADYADARQRLFTTAAKPAVPSQTKSNLYSAFQTPENKQSLALQRAQASFGKAQGHLEGAKANATQLHRPGNLRQPLLKHNGVNSLD